MAVTIDQRTAAALLSYCQMKLPEEACGALMGFVNPIDSSEMQITRFIPITNRASQPETSFSFDAREWVSLVWREHQPDELIGIFHSHPTAPAIPSLQDLDSAWSHLPVHLIIAMETGEWFAYTTKNHSTAISGDWFNGLNIRINPPA